MKGWKGMAESRTVSTEGQSPVAFLNEKIVSHNEGMLQEVQNQGQNRYVEKEEMKELIHNQLDIIEKALVEFVEGYGQKTVPQQVATKESFSQKITDALKNFADKVKHFFRAADEKTELRDPVRATQEAREQVAQRGFRSIPMKQAVEELEKPFVKQSLEDQKEDVRQTVEQSTAQGPLNEEKLMAILDKHFASVETMVMGHLGNVSGLVEGNQLPATEAVESARKSFKERMVDMKEQLQGKVNQVVEKTVVPVKEKVEQLQLKVKQYTSDKLVKIGDKLTTAGVALDPQKKEAAVYFSEYPDVILSDDKVLPEEIQTYDNENTPEDAIDARREVTEQWVKEFAGEQMEPTNIMTDHLSMLNVLKMGTSQDMIDFIQEQHQHSKELEVMQKPIKEIATEDVIIAAKQDYKAFLLGERTNGQLKDYDERFGVEEGILLRLEAVDEEKIFGDMKMYSVYEERGEELAAVIRNGTTDEKMDYLRSEDPFSSLGVEKMTEEQVADKLAPDMEQANLKENYKAFVKNHYDGELAPTSESLNQYDKEYGVEAGMLLRSQALTEMLSDPDLHVNVQEYAEEVRRNISNSVANGKDGMLQFKENEREGNIETQTQHAQNQSAPVKGIG